MAITIGKRKIRKSKQTVRGHRPTVSGDPNDPTKMYGMKVPASMHRFLLEIGPDAVKDILKMAKEAFESENHRSTKKAKRPSTES